MTDRPSRHVQVSPASERPPAADEPNDAQRRMLRVCQAALAAIEAHDEYEDGDNAIVLVSEHGARGISVHNYDNENGDLAAADFFEHLRSMVADAGIDVQLIDEHGRRVDADDYQQQCEDDRRATGDERIAAASAAQIDDEIELVLVPARGPMPKRYLLGPVAAQSLRLLLDEALAEQPEAGP